MLGARAHTGDSVSSLIRRTLLQTPLGQSCLSFGNTLGAVSRNPFGISRATEFSLGRVCLQSCCGDKGWGDRASWVRLALSWWDRARSSLGLGNHRSNDDSLRLGDGANRLCNACGNPFRGGCYSRGLLDVRS